MVLRCYKWFRAVPALRGTLFLRAVQVWSENTIQTKHRVLRLLMVLFSQPGQVEVAIMNMVSLRGLAEA